MYSSICPYSLPYSHFSLKHMWKWVAEFTAILSVIMPLPLIGGGIKWWCCLTSVWCLSVMYIGPKLRTERPRKTKIGTEVAHITHDSDTTFKVKRSKVKVTRPLYSSRCLCIRQLQRWPWEYIHRVNLLLHYGLQARWREALQCPLREERDGAYHGGRPPTACFSWYKWL